MFKGISFAFDLVYQFILNACAYSFNFILQRHKTYVASRTCLMRGHYSAHKCESAVIRHLTKKYKYDSSNMRQN